MAAVLKAGSRFKSAVCDTQVMLVKAPAGEHVLSCGGVEMIAPTATGGGTPAPEFAGGTMIGKRYVNADESLEVLCTKGGAGSLALNGEALQVKQAKQLPSSD
ncbi:hypothetical protein SAMN04488038_11850 [Solimonas aquatica]|uniref:Uncharacterized protein n=1 Tax=Solimonas aquatica TaxID=489703 RepID=A0A1H9M2E4_9GAMM|nr:hypothetical protein [Solimonas aquatica]SER17856.1 hypothetical protein SAMN04488038_11850 [Solimonas aquatica]